MMNLTSIFTVAILICGITCNQNKASQPCKETPCNSSSKYKSFLRKHVLQSTFNRLAESAWESYLKEKQLWCRNNAPIQSFLEPNQNVEDICINGLRVENGGNLCISRSEMEFYDVEIIKDNNGCRVKIHPRKARVIVACDLVKRNNKDLQCLPVHYQKNTGQKATSVPCSPQ
ncbi:unnamed protein product [Ophioblennius macclurei]